MIKGTDDFEIIPTSLFRGYVSDIDPTNASEKILVRGSINVYKKHSGTIANRPGRLLYDATVDTTEADCKTGFVWNTSLGAEIPLRVANSKLQFYSTVSGSGVWYDLLTSLSKTRFTFSPWWDNTDKKSLLLMANGTDQTIYDWAGGIAKFVSYAGGVITLDRNAGTAGFASSGTVVINGVDYTYTGISGSTLTGTSDASAATLDQVVYSKIKTVTSFTSGPASTYACDFLKVIGSQLYLGSYTSQLLFISKNTSYTDFSHSTPRVTGEGDNVILDAPGKGIGTLQDSACVFYGQSSLIEITFNQITVGSTLSEQTKIKKVFLGQLMSAQGHEFIDSLSDNLRYLDQNNQLRAYGNFRNITSNKAPLLSEAVYTELSEEDFSGGSLKVVSDIQGDITYINAPVSGKTYLFQERTMVNRLGNIVGERLWQPPQSWNITTVDSIAGATVGFSNENPQIYQLWNTNQWHDDAPSESVPYQSIALFSYQHGDSRNIKIDFDKTYFEGYMTANSNVYGGIYYDYQGATALLSPIINDETSLLVSGKQIFSGVTPPSLGDASLGDNPLGDGLNIFPNDQSLIPKFRVICGVAKKQCFEYAIMVYSTNIDARWEILAFGTNMKPATVLGVELQK